MKLILAQPATQRFQWELDVLLTNIRGFTNMEVVLLFTEHDFTVPTHFRKLGCGVFTFDNPHDEYVASVRPYLLWKYFEQNPEALDETYFYIDSDIIFREWIDFTKLGFNDKTVVGSDCSKYIDYNYITGCKRGAEIVSKMAEICGIEVNDLKGHPGIGAHLMLKNNSSEFWKRCYFDSKTIYNYLDSLGDSTNVQKWTAEMWAQQWGWIREGKTLKTSKELDFCLPTDDLARYEEVKILHNAGITAEKSFEYFYKGQYVQYSPIGKKFDYVRKDKATIRYVEAIQKVLQ